MAEGSAFDVKSAITLSTIGNATFYIIFKYGPFAGYMSQYWTDVSTITIPVGYRPRMMAGFAAKVRTTGGATSMDEVRFNVDGTVILPNGQNQIYGMFMWLT